MNTPLIDSRNTIFYKRALLCIVCLLCPYLAAAPNIEFTLVEKRPHNPNAFTQGLFIENDMFYESSGLYQRSFVTRYPIDALASKDSPMIPALKQSLPAPYFAEGLALHDNQLYLLTWMEKTLFILAKDTLKPIKTMAYEGQGWGLTSDGTHLIRSDGSSTLFFHRPDNFSVVKQLLVTDKSVPIDQINELEYANGYIWANLWHSDTIIQIDPANGKVIGEVNLSEIKSSLNITDSESVLNGIAWDEKRQGFWVTGKRWPALFLIRLTPTES